MAEEKKSAAKPVKKTKKSPEEPPRKLYRSKSDKVFGGVCGGFAEYFNIDSIIVRILWVVGCFMGGLGLVAYIASWIIIPENPIETKGDAKSEGKTSNASLTWGFILIVIGAFFLFRQWDWFDLYPFHIRWHFPRHWMWGFGFDLLLPIALILIGAIYLFKVIKGNKEPEDLQTRQTSGGKTMETKLMRSAKDRMIGGVCGGLAAQFNIDASLVRIGFVLLSIAGHLILGVIAYIVMLIVIPEEPAVESPSGQTKPASTTAKSND